MACLIDFKGNLVADFVDFGNEDLERRIPNATLTLKEQGLLVTVHQQQSMLDQQFLISEEGVFRKYLFWDIPVAFYREQPFLSRQREESPSSAEV